MSQRGQAVQAVREQLALAEQRQADETDSLRRALQVGRDLSNGALAPMWPPKCTHTEVPLLGGGHSWKGSDSTRESDSQRGEVCLHWSQELTAICGLRNLCGTVYFTSISSHM